MSQSKIRATVARTIRHNAWPVRIFTLGLSFLFSLSEYIEVFASLTGSGEQKTVPSGHVWAFVGSFLRNFVTLEVFAWVLEYRITQADIPQALKEVAKVSGTLAKMSQFRGSKELWKYRDELIGERDYPAESMRSVVDVWDRKYSDNIGSSDLWHILASLYMSEELIDIKNDKIATNIEIYTELLMAYYKYFYRKYGSEARVLIFTTLLPSEWYVQDKLFVEHFTHVTRYRRQLESFLKSCKIHGNFSLKRFVAIASCKEETDNYALRSRLDLEEDIKMHRPEFKQYMEALHFGQDDARWVCVDKVIKSNITTGLRDLVVFGHDGQWEWGIKSDLVLTHPVMFLTFFDLNDSKSHMVGDKRVEDLIEMLNDHVPGSTSYYTGTMKDLSFAQ
jgi:hypothetical protein